MRVRLAMVTPQNPSGRCNRIFILCGRARRLLLSGPRRRSRRGILFGPLVSAGLLRRFAGGPGLIRRTPLIVFLENCLPEILSCRDHE